MRIQIGDKFFNVVRFYHYLPRPLHRHVTGWVSTHRTETLKIHLFVTGPESGDDYKKAIEAKVRESCVPLILGQSCADWFTTRQFRVTATVTTTFLLEHADVRTTCDISGDGAGEDRAPADVFSMLCKSWFSQGRSSEAMMTWSKNEAVTLSTLES